MRLPVTSGLRPTQPVNGHQTLDTVNVNSSLEDVLIRLRDTGRHYLPVIDEEQRCFGVIGTKDMAQLEQQDPLTRRMKAWELCSHRVIEAEIGVTPPEAAKLMLQHGVHHVVVSSGGKVVGMMSSIDVIDHYVNTE